MNHLETDTHYDQLSDFKEQQCKLNDGSSNDFCCFILLHFVFIAGMSICGQFSSFTREKEREREFLSTCTYISSPCMVVFIHHDASIASKMKRKKKKKKKNWFYGSYHHSSFNY